MNKNELITAVSEKTGFSKKDSEKILSAAMATVKEALSAGEKVQIFGFGTFEVKERAEHMGRNPKSGETMLVPASKAPVFKAGKALKEEIAK